MSEEFKEMLAECFTDVLEKMAFMFTEVVEPADLPASPNDGLQAVMKFTGEHSGTLYVAFPRRLTHDLAANVLGADFGDENIEQLGTDALKEVLNVTCGHVLTSKYGDEPVFDLSVPKVEPLNAQDWKKMVQHPGSVCAIVEENPIVMSFSVSS